MLRIVKAVVIHLLTIATLYSNLFGQSSGRSNNLLSKHDSVRIIMMIKKANVMGMSKDKVDSSFMIFKEALRESEQKKFNRGIVKSLSGLAGYYYYNTQYDSSIYFLEKAKPFTVHLPKPYSSMIEMQYGNVYTSKGDYREAMDHLLKTLALSDSSDKKMICILYQNIADVQIKLNKLEEAYYYIDKAERLAIQTKNNYVLAIAYLNKGEIFSKPKFSKQSLNKSYYYLEKSLSLSKNYNWVVIEEGALSFIADNAISEKKYTIALGFIKQAQQLGSTNRIAGVTRYLLEARCYIGLGDYDVAEKILQHAKKEALSYDTYYLIDVYNVMTLLYKSRGDYKAALDYIELSQELQDSLKEDKVKDSVLRLQFKYEILKKDNQIYRNALYINQQKSIIEKKNIITYAILTAAALMIIVIVLVFKYKRRIQKHKSLEAVWKAKISGEEKERSRLAKELHDNIGSSLFVVKMWLGNISKQEVFLSKNENFQEAIKLLDNSLTEIRNTAHNLMPELLLRYSLDEALLIYCENIRDVSDVKIKYQFFGKLENIEDSLTLIIYRIVQELLTNVLKHSKATFVLVQLSCHNKMVSLTVEDNGIGMQTERLETTSGIGLEGIKQSVYFLKGTFNLNTLSTKGTTIYIELPTNN